MDARTQIAVVFGGEGAKAVHRGDTATLDLFRDVQPAPTASAADVADIERRLTRAEARHAASLAETDEATKSPQDRPAPGARAGLYFDAHKHAWTRTATPAPHLRGAHQMQADDFAHRWHAADRDHLPVHTPGAPHLDDADAMHRAEVKAAVAGGRGHEVPPNVRRAYGAKDGAKG